MKERKTPREDVILRRLQCLTDPQKHAILALVDAVVASSGRDAGQRQVAKLRILFDEMAN